METEIGARGLAYYRRGFLFVHGIGEQQQGETLLGFSEPMFRWLEEWLQGTRSENTALPSISFGKVDLRPTSEPVVPHAEIQVPVDPTTRGSPERWLVAESRWASAVQPPRFGPLAKWLLTRGTWMILSHFRRESGPRGLFRHVFLVVFAAVPLALLMQATVLLLALVAVLPVPAVQRAISGTLLRISGFLGDSYVFVHSPWQREAILQRVEQDLAWMRHRCQHVALIAHSQGAAVSFEVLRRIGKSPVDILITFGSGIQKLEELREVESTSPQFCWKVAALVPSLPLIGWLLLRQLASGHPDPWAGPGGWAVPVVLVVMGAMVWWKMGEIQNRVRQRLCQGILREDGTPLAWLDLPASHDPVSSGPLPGAVEQLPGYECVVVVNRRSVLTDHATYWQNVCSFVPRVWQSILQTWHLKLIPDSHKPVLVRLEERHSRRGRLLTFSTWATRAAAVLLLLPTLLSAIKLRVDGGGPVAQLVWKLAPERLKSLVAAFGAQFESTGRGLAGILGEWLIPKELWSLLPRELANAVAVPGVLLLGVAPFLVLLLIWQKLLLTIWVYWDEADWRRIVRREEPGTGVEFGIASLLRLAALLPFTVAAVEALVPKWFKWTGADMEHGLHVLVTSLVMLCMAASWAVMLVLTPRYVVPWWKAGRGTPERAQHQKGLLGLLGYLWIIPLGLLAIMPAPIREKLLPGLNVRELLVSGAFLVGLPFVGAWLLRINKAKLEERFKETPVWLRVALIAVPAVLAGVVIVSALALTLSAKAVPATDITVLLSGGLFVWWMGLLLVRLIALAVPKQAK